MFSRAMRIARGAAQVRARPDWILNNILLRCGVPRGASENRAPDGTGRALRGRTGWPTESETQTARDFGLKYTPLRYGSLKRVCANAAEDSMKARRITRSARKSVLCPAPAFRFPWLAGGGGVLLLLADASTTAPWVSAAPAVRGASQCVRAESE